MTTTKTGAKATANQHSELIEAGDAIFKARSVLNCVQMACEAMSADFGETIDNTLQVADGLLMDAIGSIDAYMMAKRTKGETS